MKKNVKWVEINKFLNKEVIFIPEVRKGDFLIGHTGNYLQVKFKTNEDLLGTDVKAKIDSIEYPYVIGTKI